MKIKLLAVCVAMFAFAAQAALGAAIIIDDVPSPWPAASGGGTFNFTSPGAIGAATDPSYGLFGNDEKFANGAAADLVTWTPSQTGNFDVYVNWMIVSSHETAARYTVNHAAGSNTFTYNQTRVGNQTTGQPLSGVATTGSGWVRLGNFNLTAGSTVTLDHPTPTGALVADAVRLHAPKVDGILIDERVLATGSVGSSWNNIISHAATDPLDTGLQYAYTQTANASATYTPGLSGTYSLDLSWGVFSNHAQDAQYLIDLDGLLGTTGDQTTIAINQSRYADQTTLSNDGLLGQWSGFRNAGIFNLNPNSIIRVSRLSTVSTAPLAIDVLSATAVPEPSSLMALLAGCLVLPVLRRRMRK